MSDERRLEIAGAAHLVLAEGAVPLNPPETVFEAMLGGWAAQQASRRLSAGTIGDRLRLVRRFACFTNDYPWCWQPADIEDWTVSLLSTPRPAAYSTVRTYQQALAMFLDYATDRRYGWGRVCEEHFGVFPVQICHEWNVVHHTAEYEGRPAKRPLSRTELQAFLDYADEQVARVRRDGRKGWLAAFRDATLFKVVYAWGLRRREAAKLDLVDFGPNAAAPEFGRFGMLAVRWGKASNGGPPRRRSVLTVMPWAAEVVSEYVTEVRPFYDDGQSALWPTERGGRVSPAYVSRRFGEYRDAIGLPDELGPHCLRHAYVTHLVEDGFDPLFVQQQVGHAWGSTTALYTGVSSDFKNRVLRAALDRAFAEPTPTVRSTT